MDPTTVFCPNTHCHARGQTGQGNISIHSQKEQRFLATHVTKPSAPAQGPSSIGCAPRQKLWCSS